MNDTSRDLGALVRGYTKWDDQPGSVPAALEAILRACRIAMTLPQGPVYVALDAALQEEDLSVPVPLPSLDRFRTATSGTAPEETVRATARLLGNASRPLIMIGRVGSDPAAFERRVALAERMLVTLVYSTLAALMSKPTQSTSPMTSATRRG